MRIQNCLLHPPTTGFAEFLTSFLKNRSVNFDMNVADNCHEDGLPGLDQALLRIRNVGGKYNESDQCSLWLQSTECVKCSLIETCCWKVYDGHDIQVLVDTKYAMNIAIRNGRTQSTLCQLTEHFGEHGVYNLTIDGETSFDQTCRIVVDNAPVNSNLPILYVAIFFVIIWVFYYGIRLLRWWKTQRTMVSPSDDDQQCLLDDSATSTQRVDQAASSETRKVRLRSLDSFRGITIVLMIFVNLGGGGYYYFAHSIWNGLTVADLIFPWFLFVMGASMVISFSGSMRRNVPIKWILLNIVRRSVILFLLGLFLNGLYDNNLSTIRIFGVLQRFCVAYLVVGAILCLRFPSKLQESNEDTNAFSSTFRDLSSLWLEWLLVLGVVAIHTCITFFLPVPGCPRGYLGPGGLVDNAQFENCTGGASGYIDRILLTPNHMHHRPTCQEIYNTNVPYDPEGVLGLFTSVLTVFLGVQAGVILSTYPSHTARLVRWTAWGLICLMVGLILCGFSKDDGWIPINKNLWSLSYALVMAGLSFVPFALLYYVIDVKHYWNGAPFYQAGMNAILLYMAHECFGGVLPFSWQPVVFPVSHLSQLAMNVWATFLFVLLAVYLHHKSIFITV